MSVLLFQSDTDYLSFIHSFLCILIFNIVTPRGVRTKHFKDGPWHKAMGSNWLPACQSENCFTLRKRKAGKSTNFQESTTVSKDRQRSEEAVCMIRRNRQCLFSGIHCLLWCRRAAGGAVWVLWFTGTKQLSLVEQHQRSMSLVTLLSISILSVVVNSPWTVYSVILFS